MLRGAVAGMPGMVTMGAVDASSWLSASASEALWQAATPPQKVCPTMTTWAGCEQGVGFWGIYAYYVRRGALPQRTSERKMRFRRQGGIDCER